MKNIYELFVLIEMLNLRCKEQVVNWYYSQRMCFRNVLAFDYSAQILLVRSIDIETFAIIKFELGKRVILITDIAQKDILFICNFLFGGRYFLSAVFI